MFALNATPFSVNTPLGAAIADYTGLTVTHIEVAADPAIEGTWAVRSVIVNAANVPAEAAVLDFLLLGFATPRTLNSVTADDLSECEFTAWPPTSGGF